MCTLPVTLLALNICIFFNHHNNGYSPCLKQFLRESAVNAYNVNSKWTLHCLNEEALCSKRVRQLVKNTKTVFSKQNLIKEKHISDTSTSKQNFSNLLWKQTNKQQKHPHCINKDKKKKKETESKSSIARVGQVNENCLMCLQSHVFSKWAFFHLLHINRRFITLSPTNRSPWQNMKFYYSYSCQIISFFKEIKVASYGEL